MSRPVFSCCVHIPSHSFQIFILTISNYFQSHCFLQLFHLLFIILTSDSEYCNDVKMTLPSLHLSQTHKMFERTLFITSTSFHCFVLAILNNYFCVFYAVSYEKVRKMKLFHTRCPDLKIKQ